MTSEVIDVERRLRHRGVGTPPDARGGATVTAYVIGHLRPTYPHTDIADYMDRVVATFEPYGGEFLVHGTRHEVLEGTWEGGVVVGFPDLEAAHAWWDSPGYRAIAPLRSRHIDGDIVVVDGVAPGPARHRGSRAPPRAARPELPAPQRARSGGRAGAAAAPARRPGCGSAGRGRRGAGRAGRR